MDRLSKMNARARAKGMDYGNFTGLLKQEATWDSVQKGKEDLQEELEMVEEITSRGYRKFKNPWLKGNTRSFQKQFRNSSCIKYFIDAHLHITQQRGGADFQWEYETHFFSLGSRDPLKMSFYAGWDIGEVEKYAEKLWGTGLFEPYEVET